MSKTIRNPRKQNLKSKATGKVNKKSGKNPTEKWGREELVNLGKHQISEKIKLDCYLGYQLLHGKRTHDKPAIIQLKKINKAGVYINIGLEPKTTPELLLIYLSLIGGQKGLRKYVK